MGSAAVQGALWGGSAEDWADIQEGLCLPLWQDALKAVGAETGRAILDAGCGAGGALAEGARLGAEMAGCDASAALLEAGRRRRPGARLDECDLEQLPYPDARFDGVIAINSVMYAASIDNAMKELARVVKPGGKVCIASWGNPERCETAAVLGAVVGTLPEKPPGGGPFALAPPGALEGLLEKAGLHPIGAGETEVTFDYPDWATCWRGNRAAGPVQGAMRVVGEDKVRAAVEGAVKPFTQESGRIVMRNLFRWAVGQRP